MSRTRNILAVVVVAAALCADEAVQAAPAMRPQVAEMAVRLVDRLSQPFRRAVPSSIRAGIAPRAFATPAATFPQAAPAVPDPRHPALSPFQFRLPPPAR